MPQISCFRHDLIPVRTTKKASNNILFSLVYYSQHSKKFKIRF